MKGITINWGTGIFMFYAIFAGVLFFTVWKSTQYDHSLVVDNYYDHDLAYQQQYDRLQNAANLSEPLKMDWVSADEKLTLRFPAEITSKISGELTFYRPDNQSMDWSLPIAVDEANEMALDLSKAPAGRWKVKVMWEAGAVPYFAERIIDLR